MRLRLEGRSMKEIARELGIDVNTANRLSNAADYEKPSLLKVGTGDGSQACGWGSMRTVCVMWPNRMPAQTLKTGSSKIDYSGFLGLVGGMWI